MSYSRRQLEAFGEPLGESVTREKPFGRIYGGGGGGGPSSSTVVQSNVPDWLRPQVESLIGGATQQIFQTTPGEDGKFNITGVRPYVPYSTNPADYVAGFSPLQQQAMANMANLQVPGQFNTATQMATQAGMGGINAANQAAGYGQSGYESGMLGQQIGTQAAQQAAQDAQRAGESAYGYGRMGAGYGAQAAGLAPAAQRYGQAGADIGQIGLGAIGTGANVGSLAQQYAAQQAGAGGQYASQATSPDAMRAYMSPYMQNVVDVQQQQAQRQADIAQQAQNANFAKSGAFGGGAQAIARAQSAADLARSKQNIQAQGLQNAFQQAQQAQQFGANLGLQGLAGAQQGLGNVIAGGQLGLQGIDRALAGQQMGLAGLGQAGQLYGLGMQGAQTGLQGVGQAINAGQLGLQGAQTGMQGAGMGMQGAQTGLQGVGQQLAGYGLLGQQAGTLGQLGNAQLNAQLGILGAQQQTGAMQQAQQQRIIDQAIQNYATAQQYPLQQMNAYNALLRGYAIPGQTTTQYQAQPTISNQLAGLGTAAYGASRLMKKGGAVKHKSSGIADLGLYNAMNA